MESSSSAKTMDAKISEDERRTLEVEYRVAFEMFRMQNSQAWQTFAVVSTLALAGLAFIGQLKTGAGGKVTWPVTVAFGLGMTTILAGWLALVNRWWAFAQAELYRMREIEARLGMYLIRGGTWLREPLKESEVTKLRDEERKSYKSIHKEFKRFPRFRWRQQRLAFIIITALIFIWALCMIADVLSLI